MRNPNGYGSVYKLSGRRRKPYAARITLGFKPENGHPIYKFIGYYKTRAEAERALAEYQGIEESDTNTDDKIEKLSELLCQACELLEEIKKVR